MKGNKLLLSLLMPLLLLGAFLDTANALSPRLRRVSATNFSHTKKALDRHVRALQPTMVIDPDSQAQTDMDSQTVLDAANLTMWLDPTKNVSTDTGSGLARVTQWDGRDSNAFSFVQATNIDRPFLSRSDNQENRIGKSTDLTSSLWDKSTYPCSVSGQTVTDDTGSGRHGVVYTSTLGERAIVAGGTYRIIADVEYNGSAQWLWIGESGDASWHGVTVDLVDGEIDNEASIASSSIAAREGGGYRVTVNFTRTNGGVVGVGVWLAEEGATSSPSNYTADGRSTIVHEVSFQDQAADETMLTTDDIGVQFRAINGHQGLVFLGSQDLTSTTTGNDIANNTAKALYAVALHFEVGTATRQALIVSNPSTSFGLYENGSSATRAVNHDGSWDTAETSAVLTANSIAIHRFEHDGANVSASTAIDASGFSANVDTASGTTSSAAMNGTLWIGDDGLSQPLSGYIFDVVTSDASSQAEVEAYLLKKYFGVHNPQTNTIDSTVSIPATELLSSPHDLTAWTSAVRASATADQATSPGGNSVSDLVEDGSSSNSHFAYDLQSSATKAGLAIRYKAVVKRSSGTRDVSLRIQTTSTDGYAHFDIDGESVHSVTGDVASGSIVSLGDGWYEVAALSNTDTVGGENIYPSLYLASAPSTISYSGDSTSGLYVGEVSIQNIEVPVSFTQSTDANKPLLSERGRHENLAPYSEDITQTTPWTETRATSGASGESHPLGVIPQLLTENGDAATSHLTEQDTIPVISGVQYTMSVDVKAEGSRNVMLRPLTGFPSTLAYFDLSTGLLDNVGGTSPDATSITSLGSGWYRVSVTETATSTATSRLLVYITDASNNDAYNGDSSSGLHIARFQFQRASMNPTYIPTQAIARHGSLTGRKGLYYDGSNDTMTSTSTSADILTTTEKELFFVIEPMGVTSSPIYFRDSTGHFFARTNTTNSEFANYDGTTDLATASGVAVSTPILAYSNHGGGNIQHSINGGALTTTASGATTSEASTLELGNTGTPYKTHYGATFDKVLPSSTRQRLMQKFKRVYQIN